MAGQQNQDLNQLLKVRHENYRNCSKMVKIRFRLQNTM
ncbi:hypothetical protein C823_005724 [Eubacterium plexicaudatum ASF492]|nr:hypothetical protein C823_005724 [Eubacterium plexicaudatum ASF492]